jgi:uncharacterized protein (TIGR03435 family)
VRIVKTQFLGAVLFLAGLAVPGAKAQSQPAAPLTFEVASIKVASSGLNGVRGGCRGIDSGTRASEGPSLPLGRCVITDARLSHLVGIAFGVSMQALNTGPDWIQRGDLRFDVQAKAEDPAKATHQQLLTMLQNLLVERFQLKFHYENIETPGFALTVAKNGLKMAKSTSDKTAVSFAGLSGEAQAKGSPGRTVSMTARKYSIPMLVMMLSRVSSAGPGVDRTGLTGEYDFTLSWDEEAGPALSTALHQLGLDLKPEKISVSTFVVDSAKKPSAN